jgi:hypothetical protein
VRLGVLIAALAILIAAASIDDLHVRAVSRRAEADLWWCEHRGIRCTGFDERAHYARWQHRERGYAFGGGLLGLAVLTAGTRRLRLAA